MTQTDKKHKRKLWPLAVVLFLLVAFFAFGTGTAYQSNLDRNNPPIVQPSHSPNLEVKTVIYSSYLNVSLYLSGSALAHATGTLKIQLGSSNAWSGSQAYDIAPGQGKAFLFFPSVTISSVDSITVQP